MSGEIGRILLLAGSAVVALELAGGVRVRAPRVRRGQVRRSTASAGAELGAAACLALGAAALSWALLALPTVSLLAALGGAAAPAQLRRRRRRSAAREAERAWSAALDQLADGLEAGLAFPAAAALVAGGGPAPLRWRFASLVAHLRRGELERGLDELAASPEQPARSAAALLRAALLELPTGGLAPLLRELARAARERFEGRERARERALALRREATVLAVSPLAFLLLIGWSSPGYLAAYRSPAGTLVSLAGALAIAGCYLAMLRLGRLPELGGGRP